VLGDDRNVGCHRYAFVIVVRRFNDLPDEEEKRASRDAQNGAGAAKAEESARSFCKARAALS